MRLQEFCLSCAIALHIIGLNARADVHVAVGPGDGTATVLAGVTFSSGASITLTTQQLSNALPTANVWMVWIYDENSTSTNPTADLGAISITASSGVSPPGRIGVLIAPPPIGGTRYEADFPDVPSIDLQPGARNMRGFAVASSLQDRTGIVISVKGDIGSATASPHDLISAGRVASTLFNPSDSSRT